LPARIISFNVNGLRSRLHQLEDVINRHAPEIIALQETKVSNEEFPVEAIADLGYQVEFHGQKGQYSVNGHSLHIINGYFPQGESRDHPTKFPAKEKFYSDLLGYLKHNFSPEDRVLVMGDMNVAPEDIDVGIKPENARRWIKSGKCAFLPEERQWLDSLKGWGLEDSFRVMNSSDNSYSWFDYRSRGFEQEPKRGLRIDLILASPAAMRLLSSTGIDTDARGYDKPSDHCPVWADFA